jgi:pimeloyl-ACP methyl ester carboxylesterase
MDYTYIRYTNSAMQNFLRVIVTTLLVLLLSQKQIQSTSAFLTIDLAGACYEIATHFRHPHTLLHAEEFEGELEVSRTYNDDSTTTSHSIQYRIHNRMNLSSLKAAPILVLHGGPGVPSDYLFPLRNVVPYRPIVFYDQLGCGRSPGPDAKEAYSIETSLDDLELVIKKSGLTRFHLYGQSFGGILALEYMKRVAEREGEDGNDDRAPKCLSAILSSAPYDVHEVESAAGELIAALLEEDSDESTVMDRFKARHACRTQTDGKQPQPLADAYDKAGTPGIWRGTDIIKEWTATKPSESAKRMPSCMAMRGEHDFVTAECVEGWKKEFNHPFVRVKELRNLSHHGLLEDGKAYGEIVDSFFSEYD